MFYSESFWSNLADKYAAKPVDDEDAYQAKLKKTQEYFTPESTVLEFGCGTGSTAITHSPYVKHILAIDLSSRMIEIAQQKADIANIDNVEFRQALIDDTPLESNHYDVILGMSILHLVENRFEVIDRVYNALKPGGVFISSTVCIGGTMPWMKYIFPIGKFFNKLPIVSMITVDQLENDIKTKGFEAEYKFIPSSEKVVFFVMRKPTKFSIP